MYHKYPEVYKAGALLIDPKREKCMLVFQIKSQMWGIPKGKLTQGEIVFDGMLREVKEECGLELMEEKHKLLGKRCIMKCHAYFVQFLDRQPKCSPPLEEGKANHEIAAIRWFTWKEVEKVKTNYLTKKVIRSFFQHVKA